MYQGAPVAAGLCSPLVLRFIHKQAERSPGVTFDKIFKMAENLLDTYKKSLGHISTKSQVSRLNHMLSCCSVRVIAALLHNGFHNYGKTTGIHTSETDVLEFIMN